MKIKSIALKNFRNYNYVHLGFDEHLNIIVGDNAQGKTNLLEALYVCGFGKSFRTTKDSDLVNFNEEITSVKIDIEHDNGYQEIIEYRINQKNRKEFLVNGVNITKISDLLGTINLVLFYPDDLKLIKESPGERRKFLNRELSHISKIYCLDIIEYNRILMQRNELLKKIFYKPEHKETLEIWDEQLADKGSKIIMKRMHFIERLGEISREIHGNITNHVENLSISYITSVKNLTNYDTIKDDLIAGFKKNQESDIKRGFTSIGPHRDDIDIKINGINIKSFGSQGQQRTAALSLKLSEIEIIKSEVGEYPILLLDDVMSELDHKRQKDLIYTLKNVQTIITTTDVKNLLDDYINASKLIKVKGGSIQC
ncbi:DNA replication/repair protein RecF [Fusibacter ferrireducens]|uniref:DNA replication and repair protein RecF n=1 Tax=Fusibacter ferrireducens TaxID=2785058 RepID=A0ABR9ZY99_9FIRM|nr:DNA replication/repair protein RecF [Fusibacter ferrireducens]MBF4695432.1 DNA replication/repair protein RecF [Fusibacter ferrireducens]